MRKTNKPLKVYLSKSLQLSDTISEPVDLYPFIEGYFHLYSKQYPLTPDECYPGNYKLLLL